MTDNIEKLESFEYTFKITKICGKQCDLLIPSSANASLKEKDLKCLGFLILMS